MRCKKILIIPDRAELSSYTKLADRLNLGFEYNDFFIPKLLVILPHCQDLVILQFIGVRMEG